MLWMTVEMPTLCFAGIRELALPSLGVGRTATSSNLKAITPQALGYSSNAVPSVTRGGTQSGAAVNVSRVSCGRPVKSPTSWKFSGRNACSDIEELKEANKIVFFSKNQLLITSQFLKGLPRKHRYLFNCFFTVDYQTVWIWGNFPQLQHSSGTARRRLDPKLFTEIYFWAMQKLKGPIIILFRPN